MRRSIEIRTRRGKMHFPGSAEAAKLLISRKVSRNWSRHNECETMEAAEIFAVHSLVLGARLYQSKIWRFAWLAEERAFFVVVRSSWRTGSGGARVGGFAIGSEEIHTNAKRRGEEESRGRA